MFRIKSFTDKPFTAMLWLNVLFLLGIPCLPLGDECPEAAAGQSALLQRKTAVDQTMETMEPFESMKEGLALRPQPAPNQTAMFQGCSAKSLKFHAELPDTTQPTPSLTSRDAVKVSACAAGTEPLISFTRTSYSETCCPEGSWKCAGCIVYSGSGCQKCGGGFISRSGWCTSCADTTGWTDRNGLTCAQISTSQCNDVKVKGLSSNEACCKCNGGAVTPTPFAYELKHWAIGEQVSMKPRPRTASFYSLNAGCELADYNLTLDGSTGAISQVPGTPVYQEPFSVECVVTAHQTSTASFEAKVRIAMDWFAYGVPMLMFGSTGSFPVRKAAGTWKDFAVRCAPNTAWLQVSSTSGTLTKSGGTAGSGSVTTEDVAKAGQDGGVCVVSALHKVGSKWLPRQTKVMALFPQPWGSLHYPTSSIQVTLGEQLPILKLPHAGLRTLKPNDFFVACDVNHGLKYSFDHLLGTGLLEGYPVLEIDEDGSLSVSIAREMSALFDSLSSSGATRKKVSLQCGVWGIFPDDSLAPIKTSLNIDILDDICWVSTSIRGHVIHNAVRTEASCRSYCRSWANCAFYQYTGGRCYWYAAHPLGSTVTAWAKVTNCTSEAACRNVQTGQWYQSGLYCPVAPDLFRGDTLYLKTGATPEETMYLSKYAQTIDGQVSGCTDGNWILRQADPKKDYIQLESGEVELGGAVVRCISGNIDFGPATCGQPNVTEPEEGFTPYRVNDPWTSAPDDYWLHPCDCAPPAWGMEKPVNPESFESVPGGSGNQFIPPAFELVAGQYVCPAKQLMDNGVHFETETETMERSDCEARCKADSNCNFFWHGSQQGANTCRLYTACSHLVREMGLEGRLEALPQSNSCQVADPEACWATTYRRKSLTSVGGSPTLYWNLHQQCDEALLLGGMGVETCARPTYRAINSHQWLHKVHLPQRFSHGTKLVARCWEERYAGVKGSGSASGMNLYCVNGDWFNQEDEEELGSFSCQACVQVAGTGFKEVEAKNEQEIWYMNRMRLSLATEVVDNTQNKMHCLKFGTGLDDLSMKPQTTCGASMTAEFHGVTDSDSRSVKLLEGSNQCLQEGMLGDLPIGLHNTCRPSTRAQQIPMNDLPGMLWRIHTKDHEQSGHRLRVSLIDCWGRGAIGKVDMMHLFDTNKAQTASYVGRVLVPASVTTTGNNQWQRLSPTTGYGWLKSDYSDATEMRVCVTYSDSASTSNSAMQVRLRRTDQAGGTVFFTDSFPITWSGTGLFHHSCGPWHGISSVHCGWGWGDTCQLDWKHSVYMSIKSVELEFGSSNPDHARFFRGRLDLPAQYDGTVTANSYATISNSFYLATGQHDAKYARVCLVFTDSSSGGTVKVRLRRADGTVFFEDSFGGTWSLSGLIHADCGPWHGLSGISCGASWGNTCQLQLLHSQSVHVKVFEADLELKSDVASLPNAYLGRMKLDASWNAHLGGWLRISPNGIFIDTDEYPTATEIRPCVMFSDSSGGGGGLKIRIRRTDRAGGTIFLEDDFGSTWSGSGLFHAKCGAWRSVKTISCGSSWANTCQVDAMHAQNVNTVIKGYYMEFRAALARDVCRFAPVITRLAESTAELFKIGAWADWQYRLSDAPIYCPEGMILTDLNAASEHLRYSCGSVAGLGSCVEGFTPQADVRDWTQFQTLGSLSVVCSQDALLNGFHFEFSEGGRWIRFRYTCCHASGAPMAIVPSSAGSVPSIEGHHCPVGKDASGRLIYKNENNNNRLQFNPQVGKWCIGSSCTGVDGTVVPIGLSSSTFDITAISDFDGTFEGKGVPKMGRSNAAALKARLRGIKTPRRPKAPKVPKLETFTPEEPTFAAECMDYNRLWASIQESYKDADGTVTPHMNQLKAEPVYDLSETNPCEVAGAVSGTRGKIGGGDGRNTGEKMSYTELDACSARVITRELEQAKRERDSAIFDKVMDVADESLDLICDAPPNIETAPMGVGAEFQAEDWCTDGLDLVHAMVLMTNFQGGIGYAHFIYDVEAEDNADCDPIQAGLDRLFCDVHCVRDAVVRGDRAILRNMKSATEVTNNNVKKMAEWSVAANRAETGWLAAKLDTTEERLSIRIQLVQDALATQNTAALQEAQEVSSSMLGELAGFADAASVNTMSRRVAVDALEEYLRGMPLKGGVNTSSASTALRQLEVLYAKLSTVGRTSKMKVLALNFQREAANLQILAKKQLEILGVYRDHSNLTRGTVRTWQDATRQQELRNALVQVDFLWWQLRSNLDAYLEVAELQTKALVSALSTIESYEHCKTNLGQVQQSYAQSLKARDMGHAVLRQTWHESVILLGEMAALIVDGELFKIFVDNEGCKSTLVVQTMKQLRSGVKALRLLSHRFEVGGLPKPDGASLVLSLQRIHESLKAVKAKAGCPVSSA